MHAQGPISLSDDAMNLVMRLTAPLARDDRVALMNALAVLLRSEPQPPGDGTVFRIMRSLLSTGHYKRSDSLVIGAGAAGIARATDGRSPLCNVSPIRRARG
jgi:hypothetical protein